MAEFCTSFTANITFLWITTRFSDYKLLTMSVIYGIYEIGHFTLFTGWKSISCLKICLFKLLLSHPFMSLKEKNCKDNLVFLAFYFKKICSILQSRCLRKAGRTKITAKFELKPPPYPLVRSKICPLLQLLPVRINCASFDGVVLPFFLSNCPLSWLIFNGTYVSNETCQLP